MYNKVNIKLIFSKCVAYTSVLPIWIKTSKYFMSFDPLKKNPENIRYSRYTEIYHQFENLVGLSANDVVGAQSGHNESYTLNLCYNRINWIYYIIVLHCERFLWIGHFVQSNFTHQKCVKRKSPQYLQVWNASAALTYVELLPNPFSTCRMTA